MHQIKVDVRTSLGIHAIGKNIFHSFL